MQASCRANFLTLWFSLSESSSLAESLSFRVVWCSPSKIRLASTIELPSTSAACSGELLIALFRCSIAKSLGALGPLIVACSFSIVLQIEANRNPRSSVDLWRGPDCESSLFLFLNLVGLFIVDASIVSELEAAGSQDNGELGRSRSACPRIHLKILCNVVVNLCTLSKRATLASGVRTINSRKRSHAFGSRDGLEDLLVVFYWGLCGV